MLTRPETKLEWILYSIAGICVVAILAVVIAYTFFILNI